MPAVVYCDGEWLVDTKRDNMAKTVHLSGLVMNRGAVNWSRLRLISSIKCDNEQHVHHLSPAYSHKLHLYNNDMETITEHV